jgi:hypothetical protein
LAIDLARIKVEETAQRLQALRNMYLKEMGSVPTSSSGTSSKTEGTSLLKKGFGLKPPSSS